MILLNDSLFSLGDLSAHYSDMRKLRKTVFLMNRTTQYYVGFIFFFKWGNDKFIFEMN